ncbi:hypothetical protein [Streptomyces sp. NPDC048612]|uniref:hypothetical protein n=1 Tax=Streptomyces sp. NPDC048612 TaxID=3365579 RepID=UPI003711737F
MPDATALDQATAVIEKAWGRPIDALESLAVRSPGDDPLLRAALHLRSALVVTDNAVAVHQDRLHALTRPGHVPAFYDLTWSASPAQRRTFASPKPSAVRSGRRSATCWRPVKPPRLRTGRLPFGWPRPLLPAPGTLHAPWASCPISLFLRPLSARPGPDGGRTAERSG